jgi:hypothetical protein
VNEKAPDYINRVAGVRMWRVAPNLWAQLGGLLWAPSVREPWPTGEEYIATCQMVPDHSPPAEGCACGVYAFYTPAFALGAGYLPQPHFPNYNGLVAGVVGAAGEVELAEWGWRAARVSVEAIFTAGAPDDDLPMPRQIIADAYSAEVISLGGFTAGEYEAFCEERGLTVLGRQ